MRDDSKIIGSWIWGFGPSDRCRIGETWDGCLALWGESHDHETVFGKLDWQNGQWQTRSLFFDGRDSLFQMRFRYTKDGKLHVVVRLPGSQNGQEHFASRFPVLPSVSSRLKPGLTTPVELELNSVQVGGLAARAWHRPAGAPRAPLAVVICPGIPTSQFPSFHSGSRLITELEMTLSERHVPVAVFDYTGVGSSSTPFKGTRRDPARWKPPSLDQASRDASAVIAWAKERLSDTIVVCGFSMGSACAIDVATSQNLHAYIAISMCCAPPRLTSTTVEKERLAAVAEKHSRATCKALYICGDTDRLAPVDEVGGLLGQRSDGGAGARLEQFRSDAHDLRGLEEEVATLCAVWTLDVQQELTGGGRSRSSSSSSTSSTQVETDASAEEAAIRSAKTATSGEETPTSAPETPTTCVPETPTSASETPTSVAETPTSFMKAAAAGVEGAVSSAETQTVRVTCQQLQDTRSASALGIFHTSLPAGAVVGQLREALSPGLPESADVLDSETLSPLRDADQVPKRVTVSTYAGQITARMRLTRAQSKEVQGKLKVVAEGTAMQTRLDKLQKEAGGSEARFRLASVGLLMTEVLPGIAAQVGFPGTHQGASAVMSSIEANSEGDLDMLHKWYEIETLFRNKAKTEEVRKKIANTSRLQQQADLGA